MSVPVTLSPGMVAIYGTGYVGTTPSGAIVQGDFRIGTIYNVWDGGSAYVYSGVAIFKEGEQYARLATAEGTYTIIKFGQLAVEPPPISPP